MTRLQQKSLAIFGGVRWKEFQRDWPAEFLVLALVDDAHAFAQLFQDFVV
jgi:hypothetical protein